MNSCLYVGHLSHRRLVPVAHAFRYTLFMVYLDLAELEQVFSGRWLWSVERFNWAVFRRGDHLRRPGTLDEAVRATVKEQLGFAPAGPIRILTHLRYCGICFNPISLYYCYAEDGATLEAIVAEVHNTPWCEEYARALDARPGPQDGALHLFELDKEFHVSPFMPLDIRYAWRFTAPGEKLVARMDLFRGGKPVFDVALNLDRRPISGGSLARALLHWPWMSASVIAAIYWQALKLKGKGAPFYPHPPQSTVTEGFYHP